jgi:hypothetical protein
MSAYDTYNREERSLCAHLFRLLHEKLELGAESPLGRFLTLAGISPPTLHSACIYAEVSLIRDAYLYRKQLSTISSIDYVGPFLDEMVRLIAQLEGCSQYVLYSNLPKPLNVPASTHPRQIHDKIISKKKLNPPRTFSNEERKVFKVMKEIFLARPDLAIAVDGALVVVETALAMPMTSERMALTRKIAHVWANLLYPDFGFEQPPQWRVCSLSRIPQQKNEQHPDMTWFDIREIARATYPATDRTVVALNAVCDWMERHAEKHRKTFSRA